MKERLWRTTKAHLACGSSGGTVAEERMKRDELLSSQHGRTAGYVARIEMRHGFQESPVQPSRQRRTCQRGEPGQLWRSQPAFVRGPTHPQSSGGILLGLVSHLRLPSAKVRGGHWTSRHFGHVSPSSSQSAPCMCPHFRQWYALLFSTACTTQSDNFLFCACDWRTHRLLVPGGALMMMVSLSGMA